MEDLNAKAIDAALVGNWEKAVELNSKLLKTDPNNIDCLNRLGKALFELGDCPKACKTLRKVLRMDKYNAIAQRNLARASQTTTGKKTVTTPAASPILSFLEEPGKTKLIALVNLTTSVDLLAQNQTESLILTPKRHTVVVTNTQDHYLGSLPDDVGHRLSVLIKGGNKYCAFIKSVTKCTLVIFVRETTRAKKYSDTPSFITNSADYFSYIREETPTVEPVVEEDDDATPTAEKLHADEEPSAE